MVALNQHIVHATGENHALIFEDRLLGALTRPTNQFVYGDVDDIGLLAAFLMEAVGKAHPFEQGNKRTAYAVGVLFLRQNGYRLFVGANEERMIAHRFIDFVTHRLDALSFFETIEPFIKPMPNKQ